MFFGFIFFFFGLFCVIGIMLVILEGLFFWIKVIWGFVEVYRKIEILVNMWCFLFWYFIVYIYIYICLFNKWKLNIIEVKKEMGLLLYFGK